MTGFKGTFAVNFVRPLGGCRITFLPVGRQLVGGFFNRPVEKVSRRRHDRGFPFPMLGRLNLVRAEFQMTRWPVTAEEGMCQVLQLSGHGWAQLMAGLRAEKPGASGRQLENAAHRLLRRWDSVKQTLVFPRKS